MWDIENNERPIGLEPCVMEHQSEPGSITFGKEYQWNEGLSPKRGIERPFPCILSRCQYSRSVLRKKTENEAENETPLRPS